MLLRWSWSGRLRGLIAQSGLKARPGKLVLTSIVLGVLIGEIVQALYGLLLLSGALAALALLSPLGVILFLRTRRLQAFLREFPEVIELLSRSVRAGHPFTTGLEMVPRNCRNLSPGSSESLLTNSVSGCPFGRPLEPLYAAYPF